MCTEIPLNRNFRAKFGQTYFLYEYFLIWIILVCQKGEGRLCGGFGSLDFHVSERETEISGDFKEGEEERAEERDRERERAEEEEEKREERQGRENGKKERG